jgi:hypothetical protein
VFVLSPGTLPGSHKYISYIIRVVEGWESKKVGRGGG